MSDSEQVTRCHDRETGLRAVIAIDDTLLGPGLGGVRWRPYPDLAAAEREARRLARVMTLKNACADLPYGGAKAVLLADGPPATGGAREADLRRAQLLAFGRFVERLGGAYIPGVDMGTSVEDLAVVHTVAREVSCDRDDPSPSTALGVFSGIGSALTHAGIGLDGARVVVQGVGHVGAALARCLAAAHCAVSVADLDATRARAVAREIGGRVVDAGSALSTPCDVFAPCAGAGILDHSSAGTLRGRIVAGAANDVLATRDVADQLARQGVDYIPDFVINAGGVLHIHALRTAWGPEKLEGSLLAIGDRVARLLGEAARRRSTPLAAAEEMASHRLGRPISLPG